MQLQSKKEISPAAYPANSTEELSATTIFKSLIDLSQVKPDIKELDKFPNIDGYLELTNISQLPIGKLEVQIKKLGNKKQGKPSHQIKLEFLSYCKNSASLPVLLVVVDEKNKVAYWKHITENFAAGLLERATGRSIVIHFDKEMDKVDGQTDYLGQWIEISNAHRNKIIQYDTLKLIHDNDRVTLAELKKRIINPTGETNDMFPFIYDFIDHYNYLLDHDFNVVKKTLYGDVWKVGIAYTDFTYNQLAYVLYEVRHNTNDTLIKVLKNIKPNEVGFDHIGMSAMNYNPIIRSAQKHAYGILSKDLEQLLKLNAFKIINEGIANEYLFNLINGYYWLFGLSKLSKPKTYNVEKFGEIVFEKWPGILFDMKYRYYTDDYLVRQKELKVSLNDLVFEFRDREKVIKRLLKSNPSSRFMAYKDKVVLTSESYDMWFIKRCLREFEHEGITKIVMLYRRPDLKNESGLIWGGYSRKAIFFNLQVVFRNFMISYHQFLQIYFPRLENEFRFFRDYDILVVVLGAIDVTNVYPPKIALIKYRSRKLKISTRIEFYLEENLPLKYEKYWSGGPQNNHSALEWCGMSGVSFSHVFNSLPIHSYL
jgi:hypothetical protein